MKDERTSLILCTKTWPVSCVRPAGAAQGRQQLRRLPRLSGRPGAARRLDGSGPKSAIL